jgi:predicted nucleic acid-binding protein
MIQTIKDHDAAICGATLAEIYAGARLPKDFQKYDAALSIFARVAIPKKIWPSLGRNLALMGARGISVPFPDALIATVALENDLQLWQHDRHFPDIQKVIPMLKLFPEPT